MGACLKSDRLLAADLCHSDEKEAMNSLVIRGCRPPGGLSCYAIHLLWIRPPGDTLYLMASLSIPSLSPFSLYAQSSRPDFRDEPSSRGRDRSRRPLTPPDVLIVSGGCYVCWYRNHLSASDQGNRIKIMSSHWLQKWLFRQ